jgi:hypothetical protein
LELAQYNAVLDLYDRRFRAEPTDEYLDIVNAAAMLWRLEDEGVDVGARWDELGERAAARKDDHLLAFVDAHFMMALAATGREADAQAMLTSMTTAPVGTEAAVFREVGVPLCRALLAYRQGDHGRTVDLLLPIRYELRRLGGSHAQRDLFARVLIEAAIRASRLTLARALLAERTAQKPNSRWSWRRFADVAGALGDTEAAGRLADRAAACLGADA